MSDAGQQRDVPEQVIQMMATEKDDWLDRQLAVVSPEAHEAALLQRLTGVPENGMTGQPKQPGLQDQLADWISRYQIHKAQFKNLPVDEQVPHHDVDATLLAYNPNAACRCYNCGLKFLRTEVTMARKGVEAVNRELAALRSKRDRDKKAAEAEVAQA